MPEEPEICFEDALNTLEEIVASLERGEPGLAAALAKYENGVRLLTRCYGLLEGAERSVALLTGLDAEGNPVTSPFDATATIELEKALKRAAETTAGGSQTRADDSGTSAERSRPSAAAAPRTTRAKRSRPATEPEPDRFDPPF